MYDHLLVLRKASLVMMSVLNHAKQCNKHQKFREVSQNHEKSITEPIVACLILPYLVRTVFVTEYLLFFKKTLKLVKWSCITINVLIGTNISDVETYSNRLDKSTLRSLIQGEALIKG